MKDIMLKIVGIQTAEGNKDRMEFVTEGKYENLDDSIIISYNESELSGMEGCVTSLKITDDKVSMQRSGEILGAEDTAIEFEVGKRFSSIYSTPYGEFKLEVLTNHIENNISADGEGTLGIDYHINLQGLSNSWSQLTIEIIQ